MTDVGRWGEWLLPDTFDRSAAMASAALAACLALAAPSRAAEVGVDGVTVRLSGVIEAGDAWTVRSALVAVGPGRAVVVLDSPGGDAAESVRVARQVRVLRASTAVADGARCASACFVVFAAGATRRVGTGSVLAVHGAAEADGSTSARIPAVDALMRDATRSYGVPDAVLRHISVANGRPLYVLTPADLRAMGVVVPPSTAGVPRRSGTGLRDLLGPTR